MEIKDKETIVQVPNMELAIVTLNAHMMSNLLMARQILKAGTHPLPQVS